MNNQGANKKKSLTLEAHATVRTLLVTRIALSEHDFNN